MILCPECRAGKHGNCDGVAWDDATDAPTECQCPECAAATAALLAERAE